jgi:methylmalonyl-CoA epimerase
MTVWRGHRCPRLRRQGFQVCATDEVLDGSFAGRSARATLMNFTLDHLGIAVKSLTAAKAIYEKLGLTISPEELVEQEKVRVVMVPVGETRLELLEPISDDSVIAKFIAKHGEGLHHISFRVPDLNAAVQKLKRENVRLVSDEIKIGAGRHRYIFVHPSSTGGVLLELVEASH